MYINQFTKPERHPFGMLDGFGLKHTSQDENHLAFILTECIEAGEFKPIKRKYSLESLVDIGMLRKVADGHILTRMGKGYLYAYYGVDDTSTTDSD